MVTPTEEDLKEISEKLRVDIRDVKETYDKVLDYQLSSGKKYKDCKAAIRNWIRGDLKSGKVKKFYPLEVVKPQNKDETIKMVSSEKIKEAKEAFYKKMLEKKEVII